MTIILGFIRKKCQEIIFRLTEILTFITIWKYLLIMFSFYLFKNQFKPFRFY